MEMTWEDFTLYQLGVRVAQAVAAAGHSSSLVGPGTVRVILASLLDALDEVPAKIDLGSHHLLGLRQAALSFFRDAEANAAADETVLNECYSHNHSVLLQAAATIQRPEKLLTARDRAAAWLHLGHQMGRAERASDQHGPSSTGPAHSESRSWLFDDPDFVAQLEDLLGVEHSRLLPDDPHDDEEAARITLGDALENVGIDWWPVELGLLRLRRDVGIRRLRPTWDAARGELRLGETVIRKVSGNAKNVHRVLSCFEEDGWDQRIDSPFSQRDGQRLHDALRTLNEDLSAIRFRSDGTGAGILWGWAD